MTTEKISLINSPAGAKFTSRCAVNASGDKMFVTVHWYNQKKWVSNAWMWVVEKSKYERIITESVIRNTDANINTFLLETVGRLIQEIGVKLAQKDGTKKAVKKMLDEAMEMVKNKK